MTELRVMTVMPVLLACLGRVPCREPEPIVSLGAL
jgi:hypothetical protein